MRPRPASVQTLMPVNGSVLDDPLLASPEAIVAVGASPVTPGVGDPGVLLAAGVVAGVVVAGVV